MSFRNVKKFSENNNYDAFAQLYDELEIDIFSVLMADELVEFFQQKNVKWPGAFAKHLDLCCGTGSLCQIFAESGFETKGVDASAGMLALAREKCGSTDFVEADVLQYSDSVKYDIVTCIDDAINHLGPFTVVQKFFERVAGLLRPGGYFVFDSITEEVLDLHKETIDRDGGIKLVFHTEKLGPDKVITELNYFQNGKLLGKFANEEHFFPLDKLQQALASAGFEVESCSRDFPPIDEEKKYKIFARKAT